MAQLVSDDLLDAKGYEQITSLDDSTAQGLTVASGGTRALIQVEDSDIRWRDDGTPPTASVGMEVSAGDSFWYTESDLSAIQFISQTATDAKVNVSYYAVKK